jgi:hypothetical protein
MIEITSDYGVIGPLCWRNKSMEVDWLIEIGDLPGISHKFCIEGACGLVSRVDTVKLSDISLHQVLGINIASAPKVFINLVKTTVLNAIGQQIANNARENTINYLHSCLLASL